MGRLYSGRSQGISPRTPRVIATTSGVTDALVATYAYDGVNRRVSKVVTNCGDEISPSDGGNVTTHSYYSPQWQVLETRNGAAALTRQWVYGTQYVDEIVLMDINGDPSRNNDADGRTATST